MRQNYGFKKNKNSVCATCTKKKMNCTNVQKIINLDIDRSQYIAFCNEFRKESKNEKQHRTI